MSLRALIFDVDGTLADTERDGHLPACNAAFAALGYPVCWTWDEFRAMLHVPGNAERMRRALATLDLPLPPAEMDAALAELIALKKRLYIDEYAPRLPLRPGVAALVQQALARGMQLAIVTTSYEEQVVALLHHQLPDAVGRFRPLLGRGAGVKTAPDSPLYRRALIELGVAAHEAIAIEDSDVGLRAALAANIPTAVFYNDATFGQDFRGAALVARSLEFFDLDRLIALCQGDSAKNGP